MLYDMLSDMLDNTVEYTLRHVVQYDNVFFVMGQSLISQVKSVYIIITDI